MFHLVELAFEVEGCKVLADALTQNFSLQSLNLVGDPLSVQPAARFQSAAQQPSPQSPPIGDRGDGCCEARSVRSFESNPAHNCWDEDRTTVVE